MHEIVTIQIGEQANYLGAHFWNAQGQESYFTYDSRHESPVDHYVHFHAGIGADGTDTFTPRTLIYDFKRNFGTLRKINELYEALGQDDTSGTSSFATAHRQPPIPLHPYQRALNEGSDPPRLDAAGIRFWSDYNRVFYHPRSIAQVYEDQLEPQQKAFANWQDGEALFETLSREVDILDEDLRPLIEQCDQMQGIQLVTGVDDGWGGFAARYIDGLRDDYEKSTIFVNGMSGIPSDSSARRMLSTSNQARSLYALSNQASVYMPMSAVPHAVPSVFTSPSRHPWFTSAVQTIGFESLLLQTRLSGSPVRLAEVAQTLTAEPGRRVVETEYEILGAEEYTMNGVNGHDGHDPMQLTGPCRLQPHADEHPDHFDGEFEILRGGGLKDSALDADAETDTDTDGPSQSLRHFSDMPFPILDSFPGVNEGAKSFKIRARLGLSSSTSTWAALLQTSVMRVVNAEHREELYDGLGQIKAAYKPEFQLDSDSENDD